MKQPHGARTAKDIAERLREEFGKDAVAVVGLRVEEARRAGDPDKIALWNEAANLLMSGVEEASEAGGSPLWWLMQRIEFYRHQASTAEADAAAATSHQRSQEMTDLAMRWRELALHADLLAKRIELVYRPGSLRGPPTP